MKKLKEEKSKMLVGGATHYHWVCNLNNFWSKAYSEKSGANNGLQSHVKRYPAHSSNVYVTNCTGATCS